MPCPAFPRDVLPERSALSTKLPAAPLVCHTGGKISLLRDQMRIHMHMRKPVLAAGRSDLLDLEDDRDCQREQPAALAPQRQAASSSESIPTPAPPLRLPPPPGNRSASRDPNGTT